MAFKKTKTDDGAGAPKRKAKGVAPKKGGKAKSFLLLIGDEGGILVFMEGNKVVRRLFAPSPQPSSTEAMVNLMQSNPNVPLYLLVDNLDQQFVRQTFPPVSSLSVNGLVKRRLDRDFQPEDLKGSLFIGRDKPPRKEWIYLLIGLAKTPQLTEWIDLVSELPNEMKGIYLVPVEATVYISMLNRSVSQPLSDWQLLVTHNKVSGFRQVVMNKDKLVFTRVNQAIDDAIPAVIAGNIEQEIINTIEYLRRLDFKDGDALDITVIASHDVNEVLDLKRFNLGNSRAMTPLDVADVLGFEQAALSADRFGDVVMAAAFVRAKKHVLRFSTAYADKLSTFYKARKGIKVASILLGIALLGLSGENLLDMQANYSAAKESDSKRLGSQSTLTELKKKVGNLDTDLALKSIVVSVYDVYLKNAISPVDFANQLAPLIGPEERMQSYEWKTGSAGSKASAPGTAAAAPTPTPGADIDTAKAISVKAEFQFGGAYADLDALSRAEQAFLANLATKLPDYIIGHDAFPWATGAEKGLEISFDDKQAAAPGIKEGATRLIVNISGPLKTKPGSGGAPAAGGAPRAPRAPRPPKAGGQP